MQQSKLASFVTRFPWPIILIYIVITAFFAIQLPTVTIDTEMKRQLPADLETRASLDKIESLFGGTDMAMIILSTDDVLEEDTLNRLSLLSSNISRIEEFDQVISLFTAKRIGTESGRMIVRPAVESVPTNANQREKLRKSLQNNDFVYGNIVSKDFKHTVLIGFLALEASDEVVVDKLSKIVESVPGPEKVYVGGMPSTRVNLAKDVRKDMRRFLPVGIVVMFVFLFICFRQARGVLLPLSITTMSIVVAMGLIPLMGWKIHTITVLLPVILLAVTNDYGIHILARYQEDNKPGLPINPKQLAESGIMALTKPIVATGVTTMAGLLCLLTHIIVPAEQLGVLAAIGVAFAMGGSIFFVPAVLSILPKSKPVLDARFPDGASKSHLDHFLFWIASRVPSRPRTILIVCTVIALSIGSGIRHIVVDTNPMNFYQEDEAVWQSTHLLNAHLGGWAGVSTIASGDIGEPKVLKDIDEFEQYLRSHELVGSTTSIAGIVRRMHLSINGNDSDYDRIPERKETIDLYLRLLSSHVDPKESIKLIDSSQQNAHVIARVTDSSTMGAKAVVDYIGAYLAERPGNPFTLVGGLLDVMADMVLHVVRGQLTSMMWSVLLVGCLVGLLMRSFVAAALSMFPLALALLLLFEIMGFSGIRLNLVTAMLSSIMIGIGVDYTIHFLWRYRDERTAGSDPVEAVRRTLTTVGRGIVFNAISVLVGFAVLALSAFFPVRFFGLLIVISISACLLGALVVLPAIVLFMRPKFLETPR